MEDDDRRNRGRDLLLRVLSITALVVGLLASTVVVPQPAQADGPPICSTYTRIDPVTGEAVVAVRCRGGVNPGSSPDEVPCDLLDVTRLWVDDYGADPPPDGYVIAQWFCGPNPISYPFFLAVGPPVDPVAVAFEVAASIQPVPPTLDQIRTSPESRDGAFSIVHIDTWFWLAEDYWQPRTGARSEGGLSISVTATPDEGTWVTGDGETETCGRGQTWASGAVATPEACLHEFTSSSADEPGGAYGGSVAVLWRYTWTLDGVPQGELGTFTTPPVDFPVAVGEIQAVETAG